MINLIILLVVLLLLYVGVVFLARRMKRKWSQADMQFFASNWKRIRALSDQRHAVLEADKLLDHVLKKRGFQGSLGEKMKKARSIFSNNNALWEAHKVRNKVAHELDYKLNGGEYSRAMNGFERAFRDLGLK